MSDFRTSEQNMRYRFVAFILTIVYLVLSVDCVDALRDLSEKEGAVRGKMLHRVLKGGKKGKRSSSPTRAPTATPAEEVAAGPGVENPSTGQNPTPDWYQSYSEQWDNQAGELYKCRKYQVLPDGATSFTAAYDESGCKDRDDGATYTCLLGTVTCPYGADTALVPALTTHPATRCDCIDGGDFSCSDYEVDCNPCPANQPTVGDACTDFGLPQGQLGICPYGSLDCGDGILRSATHCYCDSEPESPVWVCDDNECLEASGSGTEVVASPGKVTTGGSGTDVESAPGVLTARPSSSPTSSPTGSPIALTAAPVAPPTGSPIGTPTAAPTEAPTASPIAAPTVSPTDSPVGSTSSDEDVILMECPEDPIVFREAKFDKCGVSLDCQYGTQTCCGHTYPTEGFECEAGTNFTHRLIIDACMALECEDEKLGDVEGDVDSCPPESPSGTCDPTIHDEACGYGQQACVNNCIDNEKLHEQSCVCNKVSEQWECDFIMCPMIFCDDLRNDELRNDEPMLLGPAQTLSAPLVSTSITASNQEAPPVDAASPECPAEQPPDGTDCDTFEEPCTYGQSCCCGNCFENIYCYCEADVIDGTTSFMCATMELECLPCDGFDDIEGPRTFDDASNVDLAPIIIDGVDTVCPAEMDMDKPCSAVHMGDQYCGYEPFMCCGLEEWGLSCFCAEDDRWECLSPGCSCGSPPIEARMHYIDEATIAGQPHYSINSVGEPQENSPLCPDHAFAISECDPDEWGSNVCNYGIKQCEVSCDDPTLVPSGPEETCGCDEDNGIWFCWAEGCTGTLDCSPPGPAPVCPDEVNDLWAEPINGNCDPHMWSNTICGYGTLECPNCDGEMVPTGNREICKCLEGTSEWGCAVADESLNCPPLDCGDS